MDCNTGAYPVKHHFPSPIVSWIEDLSSFGDVPFTHDTEYVDEQSTPSFGLKPNGTERFSFPNQPLTNHIFRKAFPLVLSRHLASDFRRSYHMNGQTTMGLAAAVRPCRQRLLTSASAAAAKASVIRLFPRCSHPPHHHHGRRFPFLVSAASHTSQSDPSTTPTPTPVASDPHSAVAGNLPFFDRVLFPASFPLETPPVEEPAPPADEGQASTSPVREETETETEAWRLLRRAVVSYCGEPVGTVAAEDPECTEMLNYDQVFIRDFVPSALAFLMRGETEIVRNFLLHTLQLQSWEKTVDCYSPGQGLMPASFKIRTVPLDENNEAFEEILDPDFGESAIGRVAPVDSGLWWIILLRAYCKITGDYSLQERVDVQTGIKLILSLCLSDGFDMFPTLLVTDGSCMIDRRMGIHGHPLEIQALFYSALRCSREMIVMNDGSKHLLRAINNRLSALSFHIREYYWVDMNKINEIYRYKTEEYSHDATNKFNIYPEQIPSWLVDWIPEKGGYLIGNLQPAHMDFRFFSLGNLWAISSSLTTPTQAEGILSLIEEKWDDLIAYMPLKICYPAMEYDEWRIITGSDPKNTPWSYHNGGSWPTLLWQFTLACIKMGRPELARRAIAVAEEKLSADKWPEYYDTRSGRFIGKQSRSYQTWTIAGFLTSKMLLENPELASILTCDEDLELLEGCACCLSKRTRCSRRAAKSDIIG